MIRKLKIKFVCINMLIVLVMFTVIFLMLLSDTESNLEYRAQKTMNTLMNNPDFRSSPNSDRYQPYVVVNIRDGEILDYISNYYEGDRDRLQSAVKTVLEQGEPEGILLERNLRFCRRITPWGERVVLLDCTSDYSVMKGLVRSIVFISVCAVGLFLGISILLANWAIRPVETAWDQQRQFVADASHELKTPLTVIMTNAELLQDPTFDETSRNHSLVSILTMSRQMRGLVEGLLNLARVDNGVVQTVFSDLDFSALVEDCVLPFEPVFFEKGLAWDTQIQPGIRLRGSDSHLRQVVEILLDNASKYCMPEQNISLTLQRMGTHCLLTVSNPSAPISREDLKNIFKRFYRIDKARTRSGSYGLGLSIADAIVRDHGGKIWAEQRENRIYFQVLLSVL